MIVVICCRWAVENFRSANLFVVEPPKFGAALVVMTMSTGVNASRQSRLGDSNAEAEGATGSAGEASAGTSAGTSGGECSGEDDGQGKGGVRREDM
jgi:hypothetical protein